jgi:hypothetical protein
MVAPRVYEAMAKPVVGHLDPFFFQVNEEIRAGLQQVFGTANPFTLALSGTGMGDINSHMKPGDIAAKPLPVEVPREMPQEVKEQARTRFAPITGTAAERGAMIRSLGAATPSADKQRNMNLLGKMNR